MNRNKFFAFLMAFLLISEQMSPILSVRAEDDGAQPTTQEVGETEEGQQEQYTITYDIVNPDDGNDSFGVTEETVNQGETYTLKEPTAIEGYTFGGWYYDESLTSYCVQTFTV